MPHSKQKFQGVERYRYLNLGENEGLNWHLIQIACCVPRKFNRVHDKSEFQGLWGRASFVKPQVSESVIWTSSC